MTPPLLTLRVLGKPGTAGSKSSQAQFITDANGKRVYTGKVSTFEQPSATKKSWHRAVIDAVRELVWDEAGETIRDPFPLDEALRLEVVFTVPKPASAPKTVRSWPIARPDALKYARAAEDHLTAGGLLRDDARIVEYGRLAKVYPNEDPDALPVPGMLLRLWRMADWIGWQRDAVVAAPAGTLFEPQQLS